MRPLKKFPKGTDLRGPGDYKHLVIWGDRMATVRTPTVGRYMAVNREDFDPRWPARRYTVSLSDLPANPNWVGKEIYFRHGSVSIYEQPFTFSEGYGYPTRTVTGHLSEPKDVWVEVKLKDLSDGEDTALRQYLDAEGYKDLWNPRYQLTAAKWRKLLGMTYEETEELDDYDMLNAAGETVDGDPREWAEMPGVYATTKKGRIKWVITRHPKGEGL